jgi:hypothetical protein
MFYVINESNGASYTTAHASTHREALVEAAAVVAAGRGNITLAFIGHRRAKLTDARGISATFRSER